MSKPRMLGMNHNYIPNARADMRYQKKNYQHGRKLAERDPGENPEQRKLKKLEHMKEEK